MSVIPSGKSRNETPKLIDLNRHIVEQYATIWESLGLELGLKDYHIANIFANYKHDVTTCCREMLKGWLTSDTSATWGKLDEAIRRITSRLTTTPVSHNNGDEGPIHIATEGYEPMDKLWKKDELYDMGYRQKNISTLPDDKLNVLDQVLLLLLTVNDNEDNAALCYLEPLPDHDKIFRHFQRDDAGVQTQHAIYLIGKYGACPAAIKQIKPGAEIGGATTAPNLAFRCFKSLNVIIGMGVACGVEKEVKLCDVLVADKVNNYDQARLEQGGPLSRGYALPTSNLLSSIFRQKLMWPDGEIKKRLDEFNVKPKIKQGIILSGPYLIDDIEIKKDLIQNFASEAIGIEMEAAYLFKGAQQVPTHMTIVKAVCDFGDGKKNKVFQPTAALLVANCVKRYLDDEGVVKMLHKAPTQ